MRKIQLINLLADTFSSSKVINLLIFITFAIVMTAALGARYYLFQSIIADDGTSKRDIVAPKTIKVVDTFKTEQNKKRNRPEGRAYPHSGRRFIHKKQLCNARKIY